MKKKFHRKTLATVEFDCYGPPGVGTERMMIEIMMVRIVASGLITPDITGKSV
jgi:hypothetical protein